MNKISPQTEWKYLLGREEVPKIKKAGVFAAQGSDAQVQLCEEALIAPACITAGQYV